MAAAPYPAYGIHYARIEPWSKLLIFPRMGEPWGIVLLESAKESGSDGGGGRIRTFEVDDGRFTVCSLWPLGNPTRGNSNFEIKLRDGGGGRIIRRFAPHTSGRCLRQRCLAFARLEPWSKILTLPDKCKHRLHSSVLPQQRGKEWWWGKDSNLRSR